MEEANLEAGKYQVSIGLSSDLIDIIEKALDEKVNTPRGVPFLKT